MRDIATKVDGVDDLGATEFNSTQVECENVIKGTYQTLDGAAGPDNNINQLGKAMRVYASTGSSYQDSGIAGAYVLSTPITIQKMPSYIDGMKVKWKAANPNAGSSTINVDNIGVRPLTQYDGSALDSAQVNTNDYVSAVFNATNNRFELEGIVDTQFAAGTIMLFGNSTAPIGWTRKTNWTNNAMLCVASSGTPGSGGSVNPQSSHYHSGVNHTHSMQSHYHSLQNHTHPGTYHLHSTTGHTLSINEMPEHDHDLEDTHGQRFYVMNDFDNVPTLPAIRGDGPSETNGGQWWDHVAKTGGGASHSHGSTAAGGAGNTGGPDQLVSGGPNNNTTTSNGAGNTSTRSAPYYQEVLAATKD